MGNVWLLVAGMDATLFVAACGGAYNGGIVHVGAVAEARVSGVRAGGVEKGHEDALFHELVDFGHSLVQ